MGQVRATADDIGRLRRAVLVLPNDREGARALVVQAPADPLLTALRPPFLVVSGAAEPAGYVERD